MDTELVVRAQRGDGAAFEELAKGSVDRLHDVARSILSDARLAEDATQQALLDIWQDLPRLREPARFEAWSYRLLVHACYDEARRERRWMPDLPPFWIGEPAGRDEIAAVVDREQLERGFRRLSVEQRGRPAETRSLPWSTASSSSAASVASPSNSGPSWSCTTTVVCPSTRSPTCSASGLARCIHGFIAPCNAFALHSMRIGGPQLERQPVRRSRDEPPA